MACPDDNLLVAMVERSLAPEQFAALEVHIDSCVHCRQVIAAAVADTAFAVGTPEQTEHPSGEYPALKAMIDVSINDRYVIEATLGRGGMGTVYLARDLTLEREVALKLHRAGSTSDRLHREALAMAKLAHPNVVTVYEVANVDDRLYVAMEYVKGETLRGWRTAAVRSWRQIIAMMLEVGQGLAAAHAAGLVHRDFKPENVLVGEDGRPRVGDFGLARSGASISGDGSLSKSTPLDARMTMTGALLGTPAYMAPEQLAAEVVDHRCDQFGFCVVTWELLYGKRPFSGPTLAAIEESITAGKPWLPDRTDVPARVRDVLQRGLSVRPDDRFPDMPALMRALRSAAQPRTRRGIAIGVAAAVVLAGGGFAASSTISQRNHAATCAAAGDDTRALFGPLQQTQARIAFLATGAADAVGSYDRTAKVVTRFADKLGRQAVEQCQGRAEPREVTEARAHCLANNRHELATFVANLGEADFHLVRASTNAAWAMSELEPCDDVQTLIARRATSAATPPEESEKLRKGYNLEALGKFKEAIAIARPLTDAAHARGDRNVELGGLLLLARLYTDAEDADNIVKSYEEATALAEVLSRDLDAALAYSGLANFYGVQANDYAKAHHSIELARAKIQRLGGENPAISSELVLIEGQVLADENRLGEAETALRKAITNIEKEYGPEHPKLGVGYGTLSQVLRAEYKVEEALVAAQRTRDVMIASYGPDHPNVAGAEMNLGQSLSDVGKHAEARASYVHANEIFTRIMGPEHPYTAAIKANVGWVEMQEKNYAAAEADFRAAVEFIEKTQGPMVMDAGGAHADLARSLNAQGRLADALAEQRHVIAIDESNGVNGEPRLTAALLDLGRYQLEGHDVRGARASAERTLSILAHRPKDANLSELGEAKFLLAKTLWEGSKAAVDHKRALQLAAEAKAGPLGDELMSEVTDWLANHPGA